MIVAASVSQEAENVYAVVENGTLRSVVKIASAGQKQSDAMMTAVKMVVVAIE